MSFGFGAFGEDRFGTEDVGLLAYLRLPDEVRKNDTAGLLREYLTEIFGPLLAEIYDAALALPDQNNPLRVRTKTETRTIEVSAVLLVGEDTKLTIAAGDQTLLLGVRPGWVAEFSSRTSLIVEVDAENGWLKIRSKIPPDPGDIVVRPQDLLGDIAKSDGVEIDGEAPDYIQRSMVKSAHRWQLLKGSLLGFDYFGRLWGFEVEVKALWALGADREDLSDSVVYEIPSGSGIFYSVVSPSLLRHDSFVGPEGLGVQLELLGNRYVAPVVVSAVEALVEPSWVPSVGWQLTVGAGELDAIGNADRWRFVDSLGVSFWVESVSDNLLEVAASTEPALGPGTIILGATEQNSPEFHRIAGCVIEAEPVRILETDEDISDAADRMLRSVFAVVPAHVEVLLGGTRITSEYGSRVVGLHGDPEHTSESESTDAALYVRRLDNLTPDAENVGDTGPLVPEATTDHWDP